MSDRSEPELPDFGNCHPVMDDEAEMHVLAEYRLLHDGLSEMIEGDRLQFISFVDRQWVVEKLVLLAGMDPGRPG